VNYAGEHAGGDVFGAYPGVLRRFQLMHSIPSNI